jgi:hypothetical protein
LSASRRQTGDIGWSDFLRVCFDWIITVTPLQVMNGQLDPLQIIVQRGTDLRSPLPSRQNQRIDRERCRMALQATLESKKEPITLTQVAQQVGYVDRQLVYHFPEECKLVVERAKEFRKQRKECSLAQKREIIQQAVIDLHIRGIYPSLHKVQSFLPRGWMKLPEAREAWHDALREQGYES